MFIVRRKLLGASTLKWTYPDPCLVLSESDLKLYTNLEFSEEINSSYFMNILTYKAKKPMITIKIPRKVYIFYKYK